MIDTMQTLDTRGTFNSANGIRINTDFPVIDAFKQVNSTKIASATAIHMVGSNGEDDYTSVTFKVNRPFLYFIKEKSTNLVFFTGIMNKITN